nr:LGFP repeat-containing protein [Mycobacterium sp. QGD 101]
MLNTPLGRLTVALLAIATTVLLAPTATASPETEANDAITAAWEASGGAGGPLGAPQGGVYPIGAGFGHNYTGGKIFFTPATGAHFMQGAILEKYESLGGPADSDLGFPTIDEGPGRAPDSRNVTFSAADKPVVFWTPATGARVVRGPINAAWDKLGGSAGVLGVPAEDEAYRGDVVSQKFTGGELSWNRRTKTFTTVPPELAEQLVGLTIPEDPTSAINAARRAAGGAMGPLGAPEGGQYKIGADGIGQNFDGGKIFYSPATGANALTGQVLEKYESVGGPEGDLGFPTSSEVDGGHGSESRMVTFAAEDNPVIFWTPDYGAVIVRGAMAAAWNKLDGAKGPLGAPMADQSEDGDVITQRFSGGAISYDRANRSFSTEPPDLASSLSDLQVPEQPEPQAPSAPQASEDNGSKLFDFRWNWWWLLAILPVLALAGLIAGAAMLNRRRGRDDDWLDHGDFGPNGETSYDAAPAGAMGRTTVPDEAGSFADRYGEPQSASPFGLGGQMPEPAAGAAGAAAWRVRPESPDATRDDETERVELFGVQDDPDKVDTAPTRIEEPLETRIEERIDERIEEPEETHSGRHAAIQFDEPTEARPSLHLPLDDPHQAPVGYPIKADTRSGLYWTPGSRLYDDVEPEIWFASEEFAVTNGFVKGE